MGLCVVLETENGEVVERIEDRQNVLHRILPSHDDASYQLLRFIDWYGDTKFNRLQVGPFLAEWERLSNVAQTAEESTLLNDIENLARRCLEEPHLYLQFLVIEMLLEVGHQHAAWMGDGRFSHKFVRVQWSNVALSRAKGFCALIGRTYAE